MKIEIKKELTEWMEGEYTEEEIKEWRTWLYDLLSWMDEAYNNIEEWEEWNKLEEYETRSFRHLWPYGGAVIDMDIDSFLEVNNIELNEEEENEFREEIYSYDWSI